tara:strand:- start:1912 stop:3909 length:1998 start_codon:yes stop_codon:yes gene_type:complete
MAIQKNINPSKYQIRKEVDDITKSQVDWATVAGTLTDSLTGIAEDRKARKQKLQDDTMKVMEKLSEVPDLKNQTLLTQYYNGSDNAASALQTFYNQVKRGNARINDYKIFQGNVLTGFKGLSESVKNFDSYYNTMMEKIKNGEVSNMTENAADSIYSFGKLKGKTIYTNPVTGQVQYVNMLPDKDGNYTIMPDPKKNPEAFKNPMSINALMRFEEKKKILNEEAKKITDPLATIISTEVRNGSVKSLEDFRQINNISGFTYKEWMDSQVDNLTATDSDIVQILSNQGYGIAASVAEFKEKYPNLGIDKFIKVDYSSGTPDITLNDGQKLQARKLAEMAIESQIDSIVKQTPPFRPDTIDKQRGIQREEKLKGVDFANRLISNVFDDAKAAQNMLETDPLYKDVEKIVMKDVGGNQIEKTSDDFDVNKVDVIEFTMLVDGKMTPLNIETKRKNAQGEFELDQNGSPIAKSGQEIVRDILTKLKVPAAQVQSYIDEHLAAGKSFNTFEGIPSFNRTLGELGNVGGISVRLGKTAFPVDQGVTNVLKDDFKEDDKLTDLITARLNAEAGEDEAAKDKAEKDLFTYKWGLISSMLDQAFTNKEALGGRRMFKVQPLQQGETIKINYDNRTIDLGITLSQVNNNGSALIEKITEAVNKPKPTPGDDEDFG